MRFRTINYCTNCYYGIMKVSRSSYFMMVSGHPVVIPDIHTLTCDICGQVVMNDDLYGEFIDFNKSKKSDHRLNNQGDPFEEQAEKRQK